MKVSDTAPTLFYMQICSYSVLEYKLVVIYFLLAGVVGREFYIIVHYTANA